MGEKLIVRYPRNITIKVIGHRHFGMDVNICYNVVAAKLNWYIIHNI